MADLEYGSEFAIYITKDQGLRFFTNSMLIRIADLLTGREMTISDLANELGLPRSTIQSGVKRLNDVGVIGTRRDKSDARKIYCWICSLRVVSSIRPDADGISDAVLMNRRGEASPLYDAIFVFLSEMRVHGVDLSGILTEAGFAVGSLYRPLFDTMSLQEISEHISVMSGLGCPVRIDAGPEKLEVEVGPGNVADILLRRHVMMGFVLRVLNCRFGGFYSMKYSIEVSEDGRTATFRSHLYSSQRPPVLSASYSERTAQFYSVPAPFAVVFANDKTPYLISNRGMIDVMRILADNCFSVQEISAATGMPEITVHSVISRLESIGVVECSVHSRTMTYRLSSRTLVRAISTPAEPPPPIVQGDSQLTKLFFSNIVYRYLLWVADSFAIGSSAMFRAAGSAVARIVMEKTPPMSAQDFLDYVCDIFSGDGVDVKLVSYIPVNLVFRSGMQDLRFGDQMSEYLKALVTECLKIITGDEYRVIIDMRQINRADFQRGIRGI